MNRFIQKLAKQKSRILAIILLALFAYLGYRSAFYTYVSFSANQLQFRKISVYRVPFIGMPVGGKVGDRYRTKTMDWIVHNNCIAVDEAGPDMWYATTIRTPKMGRRESLPILVKELSDDSWVDWSNTHPDVAKEFWHTFCDLCRRITMPDEYPPSWIVFGQEYLRLASDHRDEQEYLLKLSKAAQGMLAGELPREYSTLRNVSLERAK